MRNMFRLFTLLVAVAFLLAACPGATPPPANSTSKDLLTDITTRGVLRISTDPAYPPQSELVEGAQKPANSKWTGEEHTAGEFKGFDITVAAEIAKRLGVEPCVVTPDWTLITG